MGKLLSRKIIQSRVYFDGKQTLIPSYDYDYTYPISVYEAIHATVDDDSPTLEDELSSIYRLINSKQPLLDGGKPGELMNWTGVPGQVGSTEVIKRIEEDPDVRSLNKIPSERAVGDALDKKVDVSDFLNHTNDKSIHIDDTERHKWNSMAPMSSLVAHTNNVDVHIKNEERVRWNNKAEQKELDDHIFNLNNPHNVTAHQVNTYTQSEIDEMFENIRESFFNYINISWDARLNQASLVEYSPTNWNPNYVLSYEDKLPEVTDPTVMYFALKPATNFKVDESSDCIIYVKRPGLTWQEVGFQTMKIGDMVIKYPDTAMYVWVQGRFLQLFTDAGTNNSGGISGGNIGIGGSITDYDSNLMWRPSVDNEGNLSWTRSRSTEPPPTTNIRGKDGYTPIKGVDYEDGKDGEGVPVGGKPGEILTKLTEDNYDTAWKSFAEVLSDMLLSGEKFPDGFITWDSIVGRPKSYDTLGTNEDGFVTQKGVSDRFDYMDNKIQSIMDTVNGSSGIDKVNQALKDHIDDIRNPHRVTPQQIGAATVTELGNHVSSFDNPHNVTAAQVGLGNVDNTSDLDKPISLAAQEEFNEIRNLIRDISGGIGGSTGIIGDYVTDVVFNENLSTFIFTFNSGEEKRIPVELEPNVFEKIEFDDRAKELVFIFVDGTEMRVPINALTCKGSTSSTIFVDVDTDNTIKAAIIPSSIGKYEIASSVELRGSPTTTTQPANDKSARIATTEYVRNLTIDNLTSYEVERPLSANMGRILNQEKASIQQMYDIIGEIEGIRVIDSLDSTSTSAALSANRGRELNLTKAPRVHTSTEGSTFGRAALGLWGHVKPSETPPLMDGTVYVGDDDGTYARGNHRHATDLTRSPVNFPDVENNIYSLTGEPRSTTPPDDSNDDRIVTTEWVRKNAPGTYFGICNTDSESANKYVELKSSTNEFNIPFDLKIGTTICITFAHLDKSNKENPTSLTIGSGERVEIHYGGISLENGMIGTNHTHLFSYDGTYWNLINPVTTGGKVTDDELIFDNGSCDECNDGYEPSPSVLRFNYILENNDLTLYPDNELDQVIRNGIEMHNPENADYRELLRIVDIGASSPVDMTNPDAVMILNLVNTGSTITFNPYNQQMVRLYRLVTIADEAGYYFIGDDCVPIYECVEASAKMTSSWNKVNIDIPPELIITEECAPVDMDFIRVNAITNFAEKTRRIYDPTAQFIMKDIPYTPDDNVVDYIACSILRTNELVNTAYDSLSFYNPSDYDITVNDSSCSYNGEMIDGRLVDDLVDFAFKCTLGYDLNHDLNVTGGCACTTNKWNRQELDALVDYAIDTKSDKGFKVPLNTNNKLDDVDADKYKIMNVGKMWRLVNFGADINGDANLDNPNVIIPTENTLCDIGTLPTMSFIDLNEIVKQTFDNRIPARPLAA